MVGERHVDKEEKRTSAGTRSASAQVGCCGHTQLARALRGAVSSNSMASSAGMASTVLR